MISVDIRFWSYVAAMQAAFSDPVWDALARGVRVGGSVYVRLQCSEDVARTLERWFASQAEELGRTDEGQRALAYATTAKTIHVALEQRR
jgi:hypothetical protein